MENDKWYTNALLILLVTLLSPFILTYRCRLVCHF